MAGNLVPITKSDEQLVFKIRSFQENRLPFLVRLRDQDAEPTGRIFFMRDAKTYKHDSLGQNIPVCNLMLSLPEMAKTDSRRMSSEDTNEG